MRPIARDQNTLQFPLNDLLGTGAHVRLLRILANEVVGPITAPDAAERAGLTQTGARRALARLSRTGFVVRVGGGRSQQFALRDTDPMIADLSRLFRTEQRRYDQLLSEIRDCFEGLNEVRTAWIQVMPEHLGEPLELGVLGDSESLSWLTEEVRRRLLQVEEHFDVTMEVHGYTRADAPVVPWSQVTLLAGLAPTQPPTLRHETSTHGDREQRALKLSQAVTGLLDRDPSLIRRAQRRIEQILTEEQGMAAHDLREWQAILESYSPKRLREFLVSSTSRAQRLRQSSPFFAVLNGEERDRLMEFLEQQE